MGTEAAQQGGTETRSHEGSGLRGAGRFRCVTRGACLGRIAGGLSKWAIIPSMSTLPVYILFVWWTRREPEGGADDCMGVFRTLAEAKAALPAGAAAGHIAEVVDEPNDRGLPPLRLRIVARLFQGEWRDVLHIPSQQNRNYR